MFVLIAGGGRTAATLARMLAADHEVRLIEHRREVLAHLHRELRTEIIYEGHATEPRTLERAGITRADAIVAAMATDAENLAVCFVARELFGIRRTIATIDNPRTAWLYTAAFHVDVALNQADILASLIRQKMSLGDMMTLLKLRQGSYALVSETLPEHSRARGMAIRDAPLPRHSVICAILRGGDVVIPRGDVRFEVGDEVLALVDEDAARELAEFFGHPEARVDEAR